MKYRNLGKTGFKISEVSFGAWAIGADWGKVDDKQSLEALNRAIDLGVNFIDTADVYGDGRSEKLIAKLKKERKERIIVATKAGRRLSPHTTEGYNPKNLEKFINRSLKNLQTNSLDLLQLHCPPTPVYYKPDVFHFLDKMVKKGKIKNYGVSVEKVEEALKAIEYPGVKTIQMIFNIFRQRPKELFFQQAKKKNIGIIVRVPLASGLLTGKMTKKSKFQKSDHRNYNREGQAFDRGETFAGVDFETGLKAVSKLKDIKPKEMTMPQLALRFILDYKEVGCVIPGAKKANQVEDNVAASELKQLSKQKHSQIDKVYKKYIRDSVHHNW